MAFHGSRSLVAVAAHDASVLTLEQVSDLFTEIVVGKKNGIRNTHLSQDGVMSVTTSGRLSNGKWCRLRAETHDLLNVVKLSIIIQHSDIYGVILLNPSEVTEERVRHEAELLATKHGLTYA